MKRDQRYLQQKAGLHHGIVHLRPGDVTDSFAPMIVTCLWFGVAFVVVCILRWKAMSQFRGGRTIMFVGPSFYFIIAACMAYFFGTDPMFTIRWKTVMIWTIAGIPPAIVSGLILVKGIGHFDALVKAHKARSSPATAISSPKQS